MEKLLTVPEIAERLSKSKKTLYQYIEDGVIPGDRIIKLGNSTGIRATIRMKESDLEKWIESCRGK